MRRFQTFVARYKSSGSTGTGVSHAAARRQYRPRLATTGGSRREAGGAHPHTRAGEMTW